MDNYHTQDLSTHLDAQDKKLKSYKSANTKLKLEKLKLILELDNCKMNNPSPLSSFDYNKQEAVNEPCEFGFAHQETPCAEGVKQEDRWTGNKDNGYCCESICPSGYEYFKDNCPEGRELHWSWKSNKNEGYCCKDVCEDGYAHQSTPCKSEMYIEPGWVGNTENGWCCDTAIYA